MTKFLNGDGAAPGCRALRPLGETATVFQLLSHDLLQWPLTSDQYCAVCCIMFAWHWASFKGVTRIRNAMISNTMFAATVWRDQNFDRYWDFFLRPNFLTPIPRLFFYTKKWQKSLKCDPSALVIALAITMFHFWNLTVSQILTVDTNCPWWMYFLIYPRDRLMMREWLCKTASIWNVLPLGQYTPPVFFSPHLSGLGKYLCHEGCFLYPIFRHSHNPPQFVAF